MGDEGLRSLQAPQQARTNVTPVIIGNGPHCLHALAVFPWERPPHAQNPPALRRESTAAPDDGPGASLQG